MSEPFLILHKVRGKPEFDVAAKSCPGPRPCQPDCGCWDGESCLVEDDWTVTTSGHRAHPLFWWKISELASTDGWSSPIEVLSDLGDKLALVPDHYSANDKREPLAIVEERAKDLLLSLKLLTPVELKDRRI